ncbi:hypothetical protein GQ44DRAFT_623757, partial [Phaeosphaeriaceae sp. PMI808]
GEKLVFSPSSLDASIGSIISFNFLGLNHSLTESTLLNPCEKIGGFDCSFNQFNPQNVSGKLLANYKVSDVSPRWFHCA